MHEAAAALGVDPLYVACQAMLSSWAAARSLTSVSASSSGKSEGFVAKSRLLAGKTVIIHNVLLSALGGLMWYLQFFSMPGATRVFRRSMTTSVGCAYELLCIVRRYRRVGAERVDNAGRRPVTVLSLGCVVIIVPPTSSAWAWRINLSAN